MMLKIEKTSDRRGAARIRLVGRIQTEHLAELKAQIRDGGPKVALDLSEVDLVDLNAVRFLGECRRRGVVLLHCSPYISAWIAREQEVEVGEIDRMPSYSSADSRRSIEMQPTGKYTHETVPTQFIEAKGIRYAYRRFGAAETVPLLFLGYFNSNMDGWDPVVTNCLAANHEIILFDNAGVAASEGETPNTVVEMTQRCLDFCRALDLRAIHVVGFSLGGMIAQQLALVHPELIQRLMLLGTGPRGGEGMTFTELSAEEQGDPVAFLLAAFFSPSETSQAAGRKYMKRLESRRKDRDLPVSGNSAVAQLSAIKEWGTVPATGRYAELKNITHPTLIVHGNKDIVVAPINALILAQHLPNAQLIVYSDSSHGAHYQHARLFLEHVKLFLGEADPAVCKIKS